MLKNVHIRSSFFFCLLSTLLGCGDKEGDTAASEDTPTGTDSGLSLETISGSDTGTASDTSDTDTGSGTPDTDTGSGTPDTDTGSDTPDTDTQRPSGAIESGYWRLVYARVTADDCGFDSWLLNNVYDTMANLYLPSGFQVTPFDGEFEIEADDVNYTTPGPITCKLSGESFACEQQTATSLWTYAIDFSGQISEKDLIRGTAVVSYLSVDSFSEGRFGDNGIDYTTCTNTILMELSWADW